MEAPSAAIPAFFSRVGIAAQMMLATSQVLSDCPPPSKLGKLSCCQETWHQVSSLQPGACSEKTPITRTLKAFLIKAQVNPQGIIQAVFRKCFLCP